MKSNKEKEFDKLADEYFDMFGQNYPINYEEDFTFDTGIGEIKKALESGDKIVREDYDDDDLI